MSKENKEQPYIVAEGVSPTVLAAQVSTYIDKGYLPHGSMFAEGRFFQPMIKREHMKTSDFNGNSLIKIDG